MTKDRQSHTVQKIVFSTDHGHHSATLGHRLGPYHPSECGKPPIRVRPAHHHYDFLIIIHSLHTELSLCPRPTYSLSFGSFPSHTLHRNKWQMVRQMSKVMTKSFHTLVKTRQKWDDDKPTGIDNISIINELLLILVTIDLQPAAS